MSHIVIAALKVVIAVSLLGSLIVQGVLVPLIWLDLDDAGAPVRVPFVVLVLVGVLALQVIGVCVWRLLTLVRRGTVFSPRSFRYVDVVIGALVVGALCVFGFAVLGAISNRTNPGDEVAPGLVGLVCGVSLVVGGVALLVYVMRTLLVQAVALDHETTQLKAELSEVI